ncbi:MAG: CvpA family protein [Candidatus Howiella sp.]|jgi:hypothetical protein
MKKYILPGIITALLGAVYFYAALPAVNLRSADFWSFIAFLLIVYFVAHLVMRFGMAVLAQKTRERDFHLPSGKPNRRVFKILAVVVAVVAVGALAVAISSVRLFNASRYQQMVSVADRAFEEDIAEVSFSQIPVVDKSTAQRLGSRKIGEVVELVSQFDVSDMYTQINYNGTPVRISPLQYNNFIKWFVNREEGIPYYVYIDMATQETQLVKLEEGMKYSPSECFGRDLLRHARFRYPTKMFDEVSFEIDDTGRPYWIISTYTYTIGVLGGRDIDGIIMVDAVSGETRFYPVAEVPTWVDQVYPADLVLEQVDYWGRFTKGYWNSVFTQSGVIETTDGYNYIANDDDVWLFTGLTSVVSDESNIGFILVNMRTKECRRYTVNGAEEYSAMSSAEGKVQEKGYVATFPILLNIDDQPTYFISLKDNAGLVKAYAFVSVSSYQNVAVGDTIEEAQTQYIQMLGAGSAEKTPTVLTQVSGRIERIEAAVREGNSYYYIRLEGVDRVYIAPITAGEMLPLLRTGDEIILSVAEDGGATVRVQTVSAAGTNAGDKAASSAE